MVALELRCRPSDLRSLTVEMFNEIVTQINERGAGDG